MDVIQRKNIASSHFFISGEDKEYKDISSFNDYFENKGTCNLLVKELNLGISIKKSVIIISFDEIYGDMTVNFSENDWGSNEESDNEKILFLLSEKLNLVKDDINYSTIFFGYEPAEDEDMQLIKFDNDL